MSLHTRLGTLVRLFMSKTTSITYRNNQCRFLSWVRVTDLGNKSCIYQSALESGEPSTNKHSEENSEERACIILEIMPPPYPSPSHMQTPEITTEVGPNFHKSNVIETGPTWFEVK